MSEAFNQFARAIWAQKKYNPPPYRRILAFDPGETTGWSFWTSEIPDAPIPSVWSLSVAGQAKTWPMPNGLKAFTDLLDTYEPDFVVYERYAVYQWKTQDHAWSEAPTIQLIGLIKTLCLQRGIQTTEQTAQVAKNFCKDDKLRTWGMYNRGQRHARDSIRHGGYYILFGHRQADNNLTS